MMDYKEHTGRITADRAGPVLPISILLAHCYFLFRLCLPFGQSTSEAFLNG